MRLAVALSALTTISPIAALATPSLVGQWSCQNYDENSMIEGTIAYYNDGTSEGSFEAAFLENGDSINLIGTFRGDWLQENTLLVENVTWVDIQSFKINYESFMNTATEKQIEASMVAEGKTFSQIIDSNEVMVVLEDDDGNITSCDLF